MPRDGTITKQRILDTAENLIIENGFAATSVDEVIAASRTSKGAFFHHFPSKIELARSLVERYAAADIAHLHQALAQARTCSEDPGRQVVEFVRSFETGADDLMSAQSSCLYVAVLTERQLAEAGTNTEILAAVLAWRQALGILIEQALTARTIAGMDAEALADHVFVTFEGAFILCRSTGDATLMRSQLGVLRRLLESLLLDGSSSV